MATTESRGGRTDARVDTHLDDLWQRADERGGILETHSMLQQTKGRLLAQAIMSNPAYVLTIEERESLIGSPPDRPGAAT